MEAAAGVGLRRTARLSLRRPEPGDRDWVAALHSDPANYPHDPGGGHSLERARALADAGLRSWERDGISYWIVEHAGEPVGMAGITRTAFCDRACWNLYYRFVPAVRGRGLAAEAAREALAVGALLDPDRPVIVRTRPTNEPARRLAQTIGLVRRADLDADGFEVFVSSGWVSSASRPRAEGRSAIPHPRG